MWLERYVGISVVAKLRPTKKLVVIASNHTDPFSGIVGLLVSGELWFSLRGSQKSSRNVESWEPKTNQSKPS